MSELEAVQVDIKKYNNVSNNSFLSDLRKINEDDRKKMLMAGVDVEENFRSGTYLQYDQNMVHCNSKQEGVEVLGIKDALKKYNGLPDYYFKLINKDEDEYTRKTADELHGGYFIRTQKGAKVFYPLQSCMYIKGENISQNVHNIVVVEEDSEVHIITGCTTSHDVRSALHLGISEFYVKKGGKLTFTMVHDWSDEVVVRPLTVGVVEEDGVFLSNYILLHKVRSIESYPTVYLNGERAVARFNSVLVTPEGSYVDSGSRIVLNAPNTRGEIISRTITTGGVNIARGEIVGNAVPARGHLECKGLILGGGTIHAIPELQGNVTGVELSHEAAVGKIAQEEIEYLMARGLDEDEATSTIVRGFLNVDIMGLPDELRENIEQMIAENEKNMF